MRARGVKPELEIFDLGMLITCRRLLDEKKIDPPPHFQLVLGTPWGAPASPKSFLHLHEHIPPEATWSVIGIGKGHLPMSMMALAMDGHIRVGMEDNIYYSRGVLARTNAEFVERIVKIAQAYGRDIATPADTRRILKLN